MGILLKKKKKTTKLIQEETPNPNSPISSKEFKFVHKKTFHKKVPDSDGFTVNPTKYLRKK
jgi:hypothetical protein